MDPLRSVRRVGRPATAWIAAIFVCAAALSLAQSALGALVTVSPDPRIINGPVTTASGPLVNSSALQTSYGVNGSGVKVGIISDSYNALGGSAGSTTILGTDDPTGTDQGRAMAEIIQNVAPGAQLYFQSAFNNDSTSLHATQPITYNQSTPQSLATAIKNMADSGMSVIVCDAAYRNEPVYQSGVVAQAISYAKSKGVAFIQAAGNTGNQSYQGTFTPSGTNVGGLLTKFSSGTTLDDVTLDVTVPAGGTVYASLQWASAYESQGGLATVDYNLVAMRSSGSLITTSNRDQSTTSLTSRLDNDGDGVRDEDPYEILAIKNTDASATVVKFAVAKYSGTDNLPFKIIISGDGTITDPTFTGSYTLVGGAASPDALTIGAQNYSNLGSSSPLESFSALAGSQVYFDESGNQIAPFNVLQDNQTPFLVGPDGIVTSVDPTFYSTSASAAYVAAAAALLLERAHDAGMNLTVDQLFELLEGTATDWGTAGWDVQSGYGILNLAAALDSIQLVPEPATVALLALVAPLLAGRRRIV